MKVLHALALICVATPSLSAGAADENYSILLRKDSLIVAAELSQHIADCRGMSAQKVGACVEIQRYVRRLIVEFSVSRREDAKEYVRDYIDGKFGYLIECFQTSCDGALQLDIVPDAELMQQWKRLFEFQACIHAAPAVTSEKPGVADGDYRAWNRLKAAMKGEVADCPIEVLSETEKRIISHFNLAGAF
jgi:hypothetical protein